MRFLEGQNCWRETSFERASLVVDAGNYFVDLLKTLPRAKKSVYILGWDFDSRIDLNKGNGDPVTPFSLFSQMIKENPELQIYVLIWCSSIVYTVKREILVRWRMPSELKKNVHLIFDTQTPFTSSHHQKIIVIDDALSYCGGMDITKGRWDLPAHLPNDPRRITPDGERFTPYHDVMIRMEGDVSRHLGELFRNRWEKATHEKISAPEITNTSWANISWDLEAITSCAISRTLPPFKDVAPVEETLHIYQDLIAGAKNHIYMENQYITSSSLTELLCARLREPEGPSITLLLPKKSENGIGNHLLMMHRAVMLRRLRQADRFGRLGLYAPIVGNKVPVYVHSKLMIIDDRFAMIGSSNLTDRSMGLDSECDIIVDAEDSEEKKTVIRHWKATLLGEHLEYAPDELLLQLTDWRLVNTWIDTLKRRGRYLLPLWANKLTNWERRVIGWKIADYKHTLHFDVLADTLRSVLLKQRYPVWKHTLILIGTLIGLLTLLMILLAGTPVREWLETILGSDLLVSLREERFGSFLIPLTFVIAGLLCVPMNFIMLATGTVFSTWEAMAYILSGMLLSAAVNYSVGYVIGRSFLQRFFARSFDRISGVIQKREFVSFAIVRMIPVAPAGVINYIAGAYHANFMRYILGTALGILPGTILLVVFQQTLIQVILTPSTTNILLLLVYSSILWSIGLYFRRRL